MIEAGREINFFRIILNKFKNKILYKLYKILKIFIKKQFKTIDSYRSESDDGFYLQIIEKATNNHKIFENFKNHPFYTTVLEHVSYSQGIEYLDYIIKNDKNFIPFLINVPHLVIKSSECDL